MTPPRWTAVKKAANSTLELDVVAILSAPTLPINNPSHYNLNQQLLVFQLSSAQLCPSTSLKQDHNSHGWYLPSVANQNNIHELVIRGHGNSFSELESSTMGYNFL